MSSERPNGRSIQACMDCRKSKLKCDGMFQADSICSRCRKRGKPCSWSVPIPGTIPDHTHGGPFTAHPHNHEPKRDPFHSTPSSSHTASPSSVSSTVLPPLRRDSFSRPRSPYSGVSPRSAGLTSGLTSSGISSPQLQSLMKPPWTKPESTSPRYQPTSWSRRRSRSPDRWRGANRLSSHGESPRNENTQNGTAPMQHLREVALLSPASSSDKLNSVGETASVSTSIPEQVRLEVIQDEMIGLQAKRGWGPKQLEKASAERRVFFERATAPEPAALFDLDPLQNGLLQVDDVERLFALYYEAINSQHCLLDPDRDSWQDVRRKSLALFIVILAAASSCDDHPRSLQCTTTLLKNMEEAAAHLILSNSKSVDVIKAVLLSFLFTQKPSQVADDRCWLLVDTAVRTATELGLGHRLRNPHADIARTDSHSIRSAERAWAVAIVMQRSLGTFTGLWAMSKLDVNWEKLDDWCNCDLTVPGDVQVVAYMYLRRIEHHTRSQFELIDTEKFLTLESIRVSFNALFESWRSRWVDHSKLVDAKFSRDFLLAVGLHIQLLLNITALRLSQGPAQSSDGSKSASPDLQDYCVSLAINLCQHFVVNFEHRAHQLCRNIVSMITWSALALLQMNYEKGQLLALRVALLLAGDAEDDVHHSNFPSFYGRWLLSLINDLAIDANARRANPQAVTTVKSSSNIQRPSNMPVDSMDGRASVPNLTSLPAQDTLSSDPIGAVKSDKLLSAMAAPLSADPFNEAWLNQFLDSLAPASWPSAEDAAALSGGAYLY